jgi:hypothetical protein
MSPSSGPWRESRGWDSGTPWSRCPVRKFFQKFSPDKTENIHTTPRVIGPRAARILSRLFVEGLAEAGRLAEYPQKSVYTLLWPVGALTLGLVQDWGRCRWRCFRRARPDRRKEKAPQCRFLPTCNFRYSNVRFRTAGFWSESGTLGSGFLPQVSDSRMPRKMSLCSINIWVHPGIY